MDQSILLQKQVRDNSEELQNFLRDLKVWEKDIKKKEAEALMKEEEARAIESSRRAESEKDEGNRLFRSGKSDEAALCYTRAIQLDPSVPAYYVNRALCLMQAGEHRLCVDDCDAGLTLDPDYTKAYMRRAMAREALGDGVRALHDYKQVLRLEPGNRYAKNKVKELEPASPETREPSSPEAQHPPSPKAQHPPSPEDPKPVVKNPRRRPSTVIPIYKAPHERSKRPLIHVNVKDVDDFDPSVFPDCIT